MRATYLSGTLSARRINIRTDICTYAHVFLMELVEYPHVPRYQPEVRGSNAEINRIKRPAVTTKRNDEERDQPTPRRSEASEPIAAVEGALPPRAALLPPPLVWVAALVSAKVTKNLERPLVRSVSAGVTSHLDRWLPRLATTVAEYVTSNINVRGAMFVERCARQCAESVRAMERCIEAGNASLLAGFRSELGFFHAKQVERSQIQQIWLARQLRDDLARMVGEFFGPATMSVASCASGGETMGSASPPRSSCVIRADHPPRQRALTTPKASRARRRRGRG